jgi:hypothetical protein
MAGCVLASHRTLEAKNQGNTLALCFRFHHLSQCDILNQTRESFYISGERLHCIMRLITRITINSMQSTVVAPFGEGRRDTILDRCKVPRRFALAVLSANGLSGDTVRARQFFCYQHALGSQTCIPICKIVMTTELRDMHAGKEQPIKGAEALLV